MTRIHYDLRNAHHMTLYAVKCMLHEIFMQGNGLWSRALWKLRARDLKLLPLNSVKQLLLYHLPIFNTNVNIHIDHIINGRTLSPPLWAMEGVKSRRGQPSREVFEPDRKLLPAPPNTRKNHCPCILEGHLATNPILSALRLQGLKSNIYVHFHLVNKQLIEISLWKWNHQWRT